MNDRRVVRFRPAMNMCELLEIPARLVRIWERVTGIFDRAAAIGKTRAVLHRFEPTFRMKIVIADMPTAVCLHHTKISLGPRSPHKEKIVAKKREKHDRKSAVLEPDAVGIDIGEEI